MPENRGGCNQEAQRQSATLPVYPGRLSASSEDTTWFVLLRFSQPESSPQWDSSSHSWGRCTCAASTAPPAANRWAVDVQVLYLPRSLRRRLNSSPAYWERALA